MARHDIDKATVRNKLEPRREPYWGAPVERGLFVGFRRLELGGNWVARFHTEDKRHVYQSLGYVSPENDYEAAKREARRWSKTVDAGVGAADVDSVAAACADYVLSLRKAKREKTATDAERRFARTINSDPLGAVKLAKLRKHHIEGWRERMEAGEFPQLPATKGRPPIVKPMSPAAFKRTLSTLKSALNRAVRERYISPEREFEWRYITPEKEADGARKLYLTKEQRIALVGAAEGGLRDLIECITLTGCRPGDPAAVLRSGYDARTGSVTFTTKKHPRTIPLSPKAKALFDRLAKKKNPKDHLFTRDTGEPWKAQDWREGVKDAAARAGLPPETVLYTLRHSWVTDALVQGMDPLTVARLAGTSMLMIEKNYGKLLDKAARESLATMDFL